MAILCSQWDEVHRPDCGAASEQLQRPAVGLYTSTLVFQTVAGNEWAIAVQAARGIARAHSEMPSTSRQQTGEAIDSGTHRLYRFQ